MNFCELNIYTWLRIVIHIYCRFEPWLKTLFYERIKVSCNYRDITV